MNYMFLPGIPAGRGRKRNEVLSNVSSDIIIETVCTHFNVTLEEIQKRTKKRTVVYKRQLLTYFLVSFTLETYKNIGGLFGMDHTSVVHSNNQVKDWLSVDHEVQADVKAIRQKIIDAHS